MQKEKIAEDIVSYIGEMKKLGVEITLCDLDRSFYAENKDFLPYNGHTCAYCMAVKSLEGFHAKCVQRQTSLQGIGEEGILSVCYAGVAEYFFPIVYEGKHYGFICAGGSKTESGIGREVTMAAGERAERFQRLYETSLSDKLPEKSHIAALIRPLRYMIRQFLEEAAHKAPLGAQDELYAAALKYLEEKYTEKFNLKEFADKLGYSESYLCRVFKRKNGKTVFAFVEWLRMKKAEEMLLYTSLSVTEIAYCLGYSDSGYFGSQFRKHTGVSPSVYRKKKIDF